MTETNPGTVSTDTGDPSTTTSGTTTPITDLYYPADLPTIDHWIRISSFKYSRANRNATTARNGAYTGHVFLPMPSKIQADYSSSYQNQELGVTGLAQAGATGVYENLKKVFNNSQAGKERNKAIADEIAAAGGVAASQSPGALTNWMLDTFPLQGFSMAQGIARNPHLAVLFEGVGFRNFSFSWEFVPRNKQELDTLKSVITHFKRARAPQYSNVYANHLFTYPDEFELEFHYPNYLFTFNACVLTDFSVDYSPQRTSVFFRNPKAPVAYTLHANFQETTIVTRETIDSLNR